MLVDKMEFKTIHEQAGEVIRRADNEDIILPQVTYKSQLECIIDEIISVAGDKYDVSKLMLEELGTHICHEDIKPKALLSHYEALVGVYDEPYGLKQEGFYINQVKDGHIVVYGSILSGKTTLLLTYIYDMLLKYSKKELSIYGIDCNNGSLKNVEGASAVSKVYYEDSKDITIEDVFNEVKSIIATRKKEGNGAEIVRSYEDNIVKAPLVLLVVDDIVKLAKLNAGKYEADILDILKDGMSVGVYVFATASSMGSSALTGRLAGGFKTSICMQLKDKYEYMQCMHYVGEMILPKKNIPGRGIAIINDKLLEFQVSIPHGEVIDSKRMQIIKEIVESLDTDNNTVALKNPTEVKVIDTKKELTNELDRENITVIDKDSKTAKMNNEEKEVEKRITWTAHKSDKQVKKMLKEDKLPLGVDSSNNQMYCINLKDTYVYTIVGGANTGKTGIIKVLMSLASINKNDKVYVVDFTAKLYSKVAARLKAEYVTTAEQFNSMLEELAKEFGERKVSPKEEKIFVFGDMERFIKAIYRPVKNGLDAVAFMENVSAKGQGHNIYFVMEMGLDVDRKLKDYPVYQNFMSYNAGLCTSDSDKDFDTAEGINIPTIRG